MHWASKTCWTFWTSVTYRELFIKNVNIEIMFCIPLWSFIKLIISNAIWCTTTSNNHCLPRTAQTIAQHSSDLQTFLVSVLTQSALFCVQLNGIFGLIWSLLCPGDHYCVLVITIVSWWLLLCPGDHFCVLVITIVHFVVTIVTVLITIVPWYGHNCVTKCYHYVKCDHQATGHFSLILSNI
jgi:hypothetical protein